MSHQYDGIYGPGVVPDTWTLLTIMWPAIVMVAVPVLMVFAIVILWGRYDTGRWTPRGVRELNQQRRQEKLDEWARNRDEHASSSQHDLT
jgi:hypothetical protein